MVFSPWVPMVFSHIHVFWKISRNHKDFKSRRHWNDGLWGESSRHGRTCSAWWMIPIYTVYIYGWWFGTFFLFPYIGNNNPNWLIFFRGVGIPPTRYILSRFMGLPLALTDHVSARRADGPGGFRDKGYLKSLGEGSVVPSQLEIAVWFTQGHLGMYICI